MGGMCCGCGGSRRKSESEVWKQFMFAHPDSESDDTVVSDESDDNLWSCFLYGTSFPLKNPIMVKQEQTFPQTET